MLELIIVFAIKVFIAFLFATIFVKIGVHLIKKYFY